MEKEKNNEKETYRLWVEYLKQSEDYKLLCKWHSTRMSQDEERAELEELHEKRHLTRKEADNLWSTYQGIFWNSFTAFHNIHSPDYSFEKWWSETFEIRRKLVQKKGVEIIPKPRVLDQVENIIAQTQNDCEQTRTLPAWMYVSPEDCLEGMFRSSDNIILRVDIRYPLDSLQESFLKIVKDQKISRSINPTSEREHMNLSVPTPITRRMSTELSTYLEVYKLRKNGLKWKDIIRRISPTYIDSQGNMSENGRRLFLGYFKKAERIIKNVGKGIFPGKY